MTFLQEYQLDVMLALTGICAVLTVLTLMTKALTPRRRRNLTRLEGVALLLLVSDRYAYLYHGDASTLGFWMVRICNFLVYFMTLWLGHGFTLYLQDLYRNEGGVEQPLKRLYACEVITGVGIVLVIISQFTGLYYTFDAQNVYHRSPGNAVCFAIPILVLLIQLTAVIQYRKRLSWRLQFSLLLFTIVPLVAALIQLFCYGISMINLSLAAMTALLYVYALQDLNNALERVKRREIEHYKTEQQKEHAMFEQTAGALANAIDAKDKYTKGHSQRVADYSRQIARIAGKTAEECDEIYYAAVLHDVGKIGIPIAILNKPGRLTEAEFAQIKQHPVVGGQILSSIQQSPYLSIAARYHHERYDGKGYPEGLKGKDIPEIARIIAVADAYDAMSSYRSYRNAIPQHIVREELVKGMGTQFDPEFAKIMIHMIDLDTEYHMQETVSGTNITSTASLRCNSIYHDCTDGVGITGRTATIRLWSQPDDGYAEDESLPTLIVFDALDGKVHPGEENNKDLLYFEYARIRLDGKVTEYNTRKAEVRFSNQETDLERSDFGEPARGQRYSVKAVRNRDHVRVHVSGEVKTFDVILALPDTSRFVFISISGEHCEVHSIRVENDTVETDPESIPRIAEEISFIKDAPTGDIPNVQVDGPRLAASEGIPVRDGMTLTFHTMSLPTARLVWHCPYISVFSATDGKVNGAGFREYSLLRLDGESWESDDHIENKVEVKQLSNFEGWNVWKDKNKKGLDCVVKINRDGNVIIIQTENLGIAIHSVTTILDDVRDVYVALTGDQCALTNIRIAAQD